MKIINSVQSLNTFQLRMESICTKCSNLKNEFRYQYMKFGIFVKLMMLVLFIHSGTYIQFNHVSSMAEKSFALFRFVCIFHSVQTFSSSTEVLFANLVFAYFSGINGNIPHFYIFKGHFG